MSERYQREIEEILQQVRESTPAKGPEKPGKTPLWAPITHIGRSIRGLVRLGSGRIMTVVIALLLSAVLISALFPGLLGPLVWLGLILFILAYALYYARPRPDVEKRWRGRPVEPQSGTRGTASLWDRFQRWLRR